LSWSEKLPSFGYAVAFAQNTGLVYITSCWLTCSGKVFVINAMSNKFAGTIILPSGAAPQGAVYDPYNNVTYVSETGDEVYMIQGLKILNTIGDVGSGPWGMAAS
jgi:DNA-binding beta-propeller fold protein YncE